MGPSKGPIATATLENQTQRVFATMQHRLDNIFWRALSGTQAHFATGTDDARRYAAGFSPIVAFADLRHPNFDALVPFCSPGELLYGSDWSGPAPAGWRIAMEAAILRMVWSSPMPDVEQAMQAVPLGLEHSKQAVELASLTRPGPFGPRTIELGEYFGIFEDGQLIAMAGERTHAESFREVSGVCTHPDHQGRGLAKQLMLKLIRRQMLRGETPFLQVMRDNARARGLYERMGFETHCETVVRAVCRY